MLARTHGQTATPTTLGKESRTSSRGSSAQSRAFARVPIQGKMNGAVGNYNAHVDRLSGRRLGERRRAIRREPRPRVQPVHDADRAARRHRRVFDALARANTILIDLDRDVWGYISLGYFRQRMREGEVGSSTMPHKVNPIDFENAEGNLGSPTRCCGTSPRSCRSRAGSAT